MRPLMLLLPAVVVLQIMLTLWLSFLLAVLYVFATDSSHIYQVLLRILFFVTPTFYSASFLGNSIARDLLRLNPLAHLISSSRSIILGDAPFPVATCLILLLVNLVAIRAALGIFRKYEPLFAERL